MEGIPRVLILSELKAGTMRENRRQGMAIFCRKSMSNLKVWRGWVIRARSDQHLASPLPTLIGLVRNVGKQCSEGTYSEEIRFCESKTCRNDRESKKHFSALQLDKLSETTHAHVLSNGRTEIHINAPAETMVA